jgi:peptidoglycan hydrolase-like amidase
VVAEVFVGVFGLFHPAVLSVQPAPGSALLVESDGRTQVLEGNHAIEIRTKARVTSRDGSTVRFVLSVPGKISREYFGRLEIRPHDGELLAIVEMDREIAVASIVQAESPPGAPMEALKAQAVVARSFIAGSRPRHEGFEFCDTTHCQFLREPARARSAAEQAATATRGRVLQYEGRTIPALYSANCGGHTRTLADAGWTVEAYPYFGVECPVKGTVEGHQMGLCQRGSAELAKRGATFPAIITHYFPAATMAWEAR